MFVSQKGLFVSVPSHIQESTQHPSLPNYALSHLLTLTNSTQESSCINTREIFFPTPFPHSFLPCVATTPLESVTSLRLLGVTIQANLKWDSQVQHMISRASRRLYILCSLKRDGVSATDLVLIFIMYIRSLLEFAAPVWSSGRTVKQSESIEKVQRRALRMIVFPERAHYADLLVMFNIPSPADRRTAILTSFGKTLLLSERHRNLLPPTHQQVSTLLHSGTLNICTYHKLRLKDINSPQFPV